MNQQMNQRAIITIDLKSGGNFRMVTISTRYPCAAQEARELIERKIQECKDEDEASISFQVEAKYVGYLNGPGGATFREMNQQMNQRAKIHIDLNSGENLRTISIRTRDATAAQEARELIERKIQECKDEDEASISFKVEARYVGYLNGPGGAILRQMNQHMNQRAKIHIDLNSAEDLRTVSIRTRDATAAQEARVLVEMKIQEAKDRTAKSIQERRDRSVQSQVQHNYSQGRPTSAWSSETESARREEQERAMNASKDDLQAMLNARLARK
jgi:flagellar hook assembly protein FlgD